MTLHQMRIFHAIVEQQSFAAAGEKLLLSQPSVSAQLKSFEKSLGLTLIDREQSAQLKGIVLTEEGHFAIEVISRILSEYEKLSEYSKNHRESSTLSIVTNGAIGCYLLPKLISRFYSRRSDTKIKVSIETDINRLIAIFKNKLCDICIVPLNADDLSNVQVIYSFKVPVWLVTAKEDFWTNGHFPLSDLNNLPLVLPPLNSVLGKALSSFLFQILQNTSFIEMNHIELVKRMLLSDKNYCSLVSSIAIREEVQMGSFYVIRTDPPLPSIDYRVFQIKKSLPQHVRRFLEDLEHYLSFELQ